MATIVRCDDGEGKPYLAALQEGAVAALCHPQGHLVGNLDEILMWSDDDVVAHATGPRRTLGDVRILAPYTTLPRNMLCVGQNYAEHSREFLTSGFDWSSSPRSSGDGDGEHPPLIVFTKPSTSIVGPSDPITVPRPIASSIDYEVELGVVIGSGGRDIPPDQVWEHIFGYTIVNDITARDLQREHRQWFLGKALDRSSPMGPAIVTADSLDVSDLRVRSWVNGELRQDSRTSLMVHGIPALVSTISKGMELISGDVIATGTPAGVGIGFSPPRFLSHGDVIRMQIEAIGELENTFQVIEAVDQDRASTAPLSQRTS